MKHLFASVVALSITLTCLASLTVVSAKIAKPMASLEEVTIITEDTTKTTPKPDPAPDNYDGPRIQLAILLDTSNSMDGLIMQAKTQLWRIVNEFVGYEHEGRVPRLEIAIYEYGNNHLSVSSGYIRKVTDFSTDLDAVSGELFALKTNGGNEFCGQVINDAVQDLQWQSGEHHLRTLFIAGNEPFTQGTVDYATAIQRAVGKDIVVNTIHCGDYDTGVRTRWRDGAVIGKGSYINIDQNQEHRHIKAPQDDDIARLGMELNDTYVPYGAQGERGRRSQKAEDVNADGFSELGSSVARANAKASSYYSNTGWDLVDAVNEGQVELASLPDSELPQAMRGMSLAEKTAYLDAKLAERKELQQQIQALNKQREAHVADVRKQQLESDPDVADTLDSALIESLQKIASEKGYER